MRTLQLPLRAQPESVLDYKHVHNHQLDVPAQPAGIRGFCLPASHRPARKQPEDTLVSYFLVKYRWQA